MLTFCAVRLSLLNLPLFGLKINYSTLEKGMMAHFGARQALFILDASH